MIWWLLLTKALAATKRKTAHQMPASVFAARTLFHIFLSNTPFL
jgi:hypothetical protein